ncbi:MAG: AMP-binding protein [Candidatus Rokubacteria bacterium]|nr:AMP-binding protein [Candidatus Rokubacteria bacterium]
MTLARPPLDLGRYQDYDDITRNFRWAIPERYNIAAETVDRWAAATPEAVALHYEDGRGARTTLTFGALRAETNRLANGLAALGVSRGDRVALVLPQRAEVGVAHLAIYKLGAIAVPLSFLYGPTTLEYILNDCRAVALVLGADFVDRIEPIRARLPHLRHLILVGGPGPGLAWVEVVGRGSSEAATAETRAEDPAMILYTSGTTGAPKGVLHAHRILAGYLLTFSLFFNIRFGERALFWTPSDWAWVGGLLDVLLPAWAFGRPVLASGARFDPERAFALVADYGVTHAFLAPTALKMLAQVRTPRERFATRLEVIASGGESVAAEVLRWAEEELGAAVNEFYGLTEVNHLIGNCSALWPVRPGLMGRPYPGREVALVDDAGQPVGPGVEAQIIVRRGDPTGFLGYWEKPEKTREMFLGEWLKTGDMAVRDDLGYYRFMGRNDDLIKSGGYRIGPAEVEEALLALPEVAEAAVIPSPDPVRGAVVKALVRLAADVEASDDLRARIQDHVRRGLAAYKYPRQIEFVQSFPLTTTGKIDRKLLRQQEAERKPSLERRHGP